MKKEQIITDFSIYHTTLENVFLDFSRQQRQETEPVKKIVTNRSRKASYPKPEGSKKNHSTFELSTVLDSSSITTTSQEALL